MSDFLIVIPCLNELEHIEGVINKFSKDKRNFVVAVDGGSDDGTAEKILELESKIDNLSYLHNPEKVQSAAVNLALSKYKDNYKYFIRVDAHSDYPDEYVQVLVNEAEENNANSVVVTMSTKANYNFQSVIAAAQNSKFGNGGSTHRNACSTGRWVEHGHHALFEIEAYVSVGGYDEEFVANEDAELDVRLINAGYRIWLTSKTKINYYPRRHLLGLFKQYYKFGVGRASTYFKHKEKLSFRQLMPLLVVPSFFLVFFSVLNFIFLLPFVLWFSACFFAGVIISFQNKNIFYFLSAFALQVMHFAWSLGFFNKIFLVLLRK